MTLRQIRPARRHRLLWHLAQIPPADLDVLVVGQLTSGAASLGDTLEPSSLKVIGLGAVFGGWAPPAAGAGIRAAGPGPRPDTRRFRPQTRRPAARHSSGRSREG